MQEDGQIEIDIWEYDISETVIFLKDTVQKQSQNSQIQKYILSIFLRQHNYTLFLLFHNSVLFSVSFFIDVRALLTGRKSHVFSPKSLLAVLSRHFGPDVLTSLRSDWKPRWTSPLSFRQSAW